MLREIRGCQNLKGRNLKGLCPRNRHKVYALGQGAQIWRSPAVTLSSWEHGEGRCEMHRVSHAHFSFEKWPGAAVREGVLT